MCIWYNIMYICCCGQSSGKVSEDHAQTGNARQTQAPTSSPISAPPNISRASLPRVVPPIMPSIHEYSPSPEAFGDYWAEISVKSTPDSSPVTKPKHPKLEDYGSSEDLKQLTVKELKILLTLNRVDFRGCIEKSELLEKVHRLWEDNNQHKDMPENTPTELLCKLCMDAPLDCVLLECGHIASCVDCGKKLAECPICRQYVVRVVRTFKA